MLKRLPKWKEKLIDEAIVKFDGKPTIEMSRWIQEEQTKRKAQEEQRVHEAIWGKK